MADEKSALRGEAEKQTHASLTIIADNAPEVKSIAELWRTIKAYSYHYTKLQTKFKEGI